MSDLLWYLLGTILGTELLRLARWYMVLRIGPEAVAAVMREVDHGAR